MLWHLMNCLVNVIVTLSSIGRVHYEMMSGVCRSICLSVASLDLTQVLIDRVEAHDMGNT